MFAVQLVVPVAAIENVSAPLENEVPFQKLPALFFRLRATLATGLLLLSAAVPLTVVNWGLVRFVTPPFPNGVIVAVGGVRSSVQL